MTTPPKRINPHTNNQNSITILFILGVVVILAAAILNIVQWASPERATPLLLQETGEIQATSIEIAQSKTQTPLMLPEDLLGSDVFVIGLYPMETKKVTKDTAIVVLEKNNHRLAQISYQPSLTLGEERAKYTSLDVQEVVIAGEIGYFIPVNEFYIQCYENPEGTPSLCQFTNVLLFSAGETVVTIANDNNQLTEGEMISWARSIADQVEE